jgi:hypothetical protein
MRLLAVLCLLLPAACGPSAPAAGSRTPEAAVRRFVEAGRAGDQHAACSCLVADERRRGPRIDYRDLGPYEVGAARHLDDRRAVVPLRCGELRTPMVAVREPDGWRVSLLQSLQQMQAPADPPLASAPR